MKSIDQRKNVLIKATVFASLGAFALLLVQNASLNTQVSQLKSELNRHKDILPRVNILEMKDPKRLRRLNKSFLDRPEMFDEFSDSEDEPSTDNRRRRNQSKRERRHLSSSKKSGSSKSSKRSSKRCSSSSTNDSATSSGDVRVGEAAECEDLRQTLFDLGSEITDLKGETLRYNAIADELYRTSVLAGAKGDESRQLANSASYLDQLEDSLLILQEEKELLKTGNERVSQLNNFLRQSAFDWLGTNANLTEENMALLRNITWLTQENLDLLNEQNRLSDQIMALDSTLDTYKNLLENHSELNGELNQTTSELASQIYRLELANAEYKRINGELSNSIGELKDQNTELAEQNQILAGLNSDLNNTIIRLDGQVDDLEGQVDDLASQNTLLEEQVDRLEKETDRLGEANDELETNVQDLTSEVDRFVNKTEELQKMNDELENIVSFVNETGTFLDQSMDTVTEYLSEQIVAYRTVATETLKNTFIQRAALWDCAYRDHFGDDDFASDDKIPIPANKFDDVMEYVNDRVLQELCLSLEDFETFLNNKFDDPVFTTDHVISGISSYAYLAFDHYFPSTEVIEGLTEADWALAGYNCNRLPADKLYIHDGKTF